MKIFILFVSVLAFLKIVSYNSDALYSQDLSPDDSLLVIEKVYLQTDRESYYPGDDLWFKAYLIDASFQMLSGHSTNLHVELISPALNITDSRIIKLNGGLGNGDFHLPDSLKPGRYRLRAYTNYMRNFGDNLFYKNIIIINALDSGKVFPENGAAITRPEISFFPEGGSLVDDISSLVAFKAENDAGFGIDLSGEVYSSTGEYVTSFKTMHKGMGVFSLSPITGKDYYALIKTRSGDSVRYDIPESFPHGVVLNVSGNQDGELQLTFKTNPRTFGQVRDRDLELVISARSIPYKTFTFRMKSLNSFLTIPTSDLPEGIVTLTLRGYKMLPFCERLVYLQNNDDVRIKLETGKKEYYPRDSVSISVSMTNTSDSSIKAFLSLSSTDNLFTSSSLYPSTISSWFLLESDIRGQVEEPSYYFDHSNPNRLKDLDMLLLTHGWRDFKWKYAENVFLPENGFSISGRVRKIFSDVPVKNPKISIAIFKSGNPFSTTLSVDSSGRFHLDGIDFTGEAKMIASITGDNDKLKGWLILDSMKYSPAKVSGYIRKEGSVYKNELFSVSDSLSGEYQIITKKMHTFVQYAEYKNSIVKKYKLSDTIALGEVTVTAKRVDWTETAASRSRHYLRGTPDKEVVITPELKSYNNVYQLVTQRYISPFKMKGIFAWGLNPRMTTPLYMIDGVRASELEVKSIPLSMVERIDILDEVASYSTFSTIVSVNDSTASMIDGVISIILRDDLWNTPSTVFHSVNVKISGYAEPRIFYSPKHRATLQADYKPDLRTTLLWKPDIEVSNYRETILNFYNGDNPAIIQITAEGITSTGIPVSGKTEYIIR